jgi:hypothetical protein
MMGTKCRKGVREPRVICTETQHRKRKGCVNSSRAAMNTTGQERKRVREPRKKGTKYTKGVHETRELHRNTTQEKKGVREPF